MLDFDERVQKAWAEQHERLWRALLVWSGDREVASDAAAEAFAQVLRRGDVVEDVARWVWTASFKIAAGTLARRSNDSLDDHRDSLAATGSDLGDVSVLTEGLSKLNEHDRTIVVMCLVGGWPAGEVAKITGSSAGAVRVRLHRAKRRLRQLLEVNDG